MKFARALILALEDMDAEGPMAAYGAGSLVVVELRN